MAKEKLFPEERVTRAIVAIDLTDSTAMKEQQTEISWLGTYDWFFGMLASTIAPLSGRIVKYLGDGGMAVFSEEDAADAINWAIKVQESIADARARRVIDCDCSIGIASGEVVEFDVPQVASGQKDYVGTVVDRAFRLCSAANAKAIFVDDYTTAAAAMTRVVSRLGSNMADKRNARKYQGEMESIRLKGISAPVAYYEILWDADRYGVRRAMATELSAEKHAPVSPRVSTGSLPPPPPPPGRPMWRLGVVERYDGSTFGFITSADEVFFVYPGAVFNKGSALKRGDEVAFVAGEATTGTTKDGKPKKRQALHVIPLGTVVSGRILRIEKDGMFGFAVCRSERGEETPEVFVHFGGRKFPFQPNTEIEFTTVRGRKGDVSGEDAKEKVGSTPIAGDKETSN